MDKIEIKPQYVKHIKKQRDFEICIVNNLSIEIECQIEMIGNKMIIWINKKYESVDNGIQTLRNRS